MSEMVHYSGTMRLVLKKGNETLEDLCKRIMNLHGYSTLSIYMNSWEEYLHDEMYEKNVVVDGELYEILNRESFECDDNVFSATDIGNGKYKFEVMYYNGGCSFSEAVETAMRNTRKRIASWIPCNEKLPEDHELYNITHVNDAGIHSDSAIYHPYLKIWFWDEEETIPVTNKITAWQPLPEPYKSE